MRSLPDLLRLAGLFLACVTSTHACDITVRHPMLSALDRMHVVDSRTRIFYALEGPHAIANKTDRNGNAIPDVIEDAATQVRATYSTSRQFLQLKAPWEQMRYQGMATGIDIHFRAFESTNSGQGMAYDIPMTYSRNAAGALDICTLRVDITNYWGKHNQALAHEIFHQIQHGYTLFKNGWYLEGMAAWSEDLLGARAVPESKLPQTALEIETLLVSSYVAGKFWSRLGYVLDCLSGYCNGAIGDSVDANDLSYVDGSSVQADSVAYGRTLIRSMLVALDGLDHTISPGHQWDLSLKTDTGHHARILDVIRGLHIVQLRSSRDHPLAEELRGFLAAIQQWRNASQALGSGSP